MSFLLDLDMNDSGEEKMNKVLALLPKYEKKIEDAKVIFDLDGRRMEEIMRTLPHHQASYDKAHHEMKALEDWVNTAKEKENARLWKKYIEGYPKALSTQDVKAYINGEKTMVELNQIVIEVSLIKNKIFAITDAIRQMGWMMGNVTKLRVAELQDAVL